jgi:hypothetical protein
MDDLVIVSPHPTGSQDSSTRLRSYLINSALFFGVSAFLLCLLEAFIWITQPIAIAYEYAECCDYRLAPNQDFHFSKDEFDTRIRINALGLRGSLPNLDLQNRLLVLGDSFAFGYGVNDDEAFPALIGHRLGPNVAVINSGHSGYDTRREAAFLKEEGPRFNPTLIVVTFVLNDVPSNSGKFWFNAIPDGWLRYFPLRGTANFLSYLFRNPEELLFKLGLNDSFRYTSALSCLQDGECADDWTVTDRMLSDIVRQGREMGAKLLFVHIPTLEEVRGDVERGDPAYAEKKLRGFAQKNGVGFVGMRNALSPSDYFPTDGHWTPSGHVKAADRISEALSHRLLLPPSAKRSPGPAHPPGKDRRHAEIPDGTDARAENTSQPPRYRSVE